MSFRNCLRVFILSLFFYQLSYATTRTMNVTLISPSNDTDTFWHQLHSFADASAIDLNINLEIKKPNKTLDKIDYLHSVKEVFERENKPDYVIAKFYDGIILDILNLSVQNKVPIFIINSNIPQRNKKEIGRLRRNFETFIGHIAPNEEQVGYDLAKYLIQYNRRKNENGRIKIAALSTSRTDEQAKSRMNGLYKAVEEEFETKLYKVKYVNTKEEAYIQTNRLINKYYDLNIIWTSDDTLSLSSYESIKQMNLNEQIITGGINWSKEALLSVKNNEIKAIIGGHFMDAGFALVLLHDKFYGKDFFEQYNTKIDSSMFLLDSKNVDEYFEIFSSQQWTKIDFRKYSKIYNKELLKYDFSIKTFFENIK